MKNYLKILIAFVGALGLFASCEKDGEQLVMRENVIAPSITAMPDLALARDNGANELVFKCSPIDAGFTASANYFLEAAAAGTGFEDAVLLYNGISCDEITITVNQLNSMLLDILPEDATSSAEFRIRGVLETDAGAGVENFEYISDTKTADATVFGLLRLDVMITGATGIQKVVSPASDGSYNGFVKFGAGDSFTLTNPETGHVYGGSAGSLTQDGPAIAVAEAGWYDLSADIINGTFAIDPYFIGLVGSATPNGWDAPDSKMDYDPATKTWQITIDLAPGFVKFRRNDGWGWNMGLVEGEEGAMEGDLQQGGAGNDIPIDEAGNYTVIFNIISDSAGTYKFIKN
ncbi:protein of unknown function [Saccharicrinis carchari]|uniref:SusE outer membrane protein domain-containing protein n=1 Tax=Saccharicrinis carchari TaxID=1168039 RepID=A0A521D6G3_SACCC|nr:SusE domain-containing protein [Saccharicrinis carchari]SMO67274.1 protein of unknown function [Saccharicrinis carchari]